MRGRIYKNTENFMGAQGGGGAGAAVPTGDIITAVGQTAGAVITAISEQKDAKRRLEFEKQLAELDAQQQRELNKKILNAQTATERSRILSQTLSATSVARIQNLGKSKTSVALYVIGGVIILGAFLIVYKKYIKK